MILCQMTTIHQLLSKSLETDTTKCRNALDYVLRLSLEINSKFKIIDTTITYVPS